MASFNLGDLPFYPADGPDHLIALTELDDDTIVGMCSSEEQAALVLGLRDQAQDIIGSTAFKGELVDWVAFHRAFKSGQLRTVRRKWTVYHLDAHRRPILRKEADYTSKILLDINRWVPDPDELRPLPDPRGVYVLVWGGKPTILDNPRFSGGSVPPEKDLRIRLEKVLSRPDVADVLFVDNGNGTSRTYQGIWSLRLLFGVDINDNELEFPAIETAQQLRPWDNSAHAA